MYTGRFTALVLFAGGLAVLVGCESPSSPSAAPTEPAALNLTGTWSGAATDSTGPGTMTWQVTHTGSTVSGSLAMNDSATKKSGRGSVSGTLTGNALHFTIAVPLGGFDSPYDVCRTDVTGDAQASASSITGTYSGTNTCTGVISSGQLTLAKAP